MFRTSGHHENRGLYKKNLKNWRFEKKNMLSKLQRKFFKILFSQIFSKQILFFMSNLNVECFQLSFDIHIVNVGQKMMNFQKLCRKFPRSKYT